MDGPRTITSPDTLVTSSTANSQAATKDSGSTSINDMTVVDKAPRVGHKKSRNGCAQCKRRHVKCNEQSPCSNCVRHGVACSLAGGPNVPREDTRGRRVSPTLSAVSRTASMDSGAATAGPSSGDIPSATSPYLTLSGLIDRPLPVSQNWRLDLQLMHHYMTHTNYILNETQPTEYILQLWRDELPKVAFSSDYVMHALLSFTALHKARLDPENGAMLQTCAVSHMDLALVLYRQEGEVLGAEDANAKFSFTWLLTLCAYAVSPNVTPIDAVAQIILLVNRIDSVLAETWFWVAQGPFAPILTRGFQEPILCPLERSDYLPDGMEFGLNHLDFMLGVDAMLSDDRRTCTLVLNELKQLYDSVSPGRGSCGISAILCFPKQDPLAFATLIKERKPQALIILGYYCILLDILNDRWWIAGYGSRVLTDILGSLGESWKHWIEWPVQSVLLKQPAGTGSSAMLV